MLDYIEIAKQTLIIEEQGIAQLRQRLDHHFNAIVELILQCRGRVVVSGIGKSGLIGKKMVSTFASTGTPSFFLHPTEAFHGDLGMLKPIDVVILISNSGETDDVIKLLPSLKNFGNKIVAMTGNPHSTLAKHADHILDIAVEREACPNNLAPTTSALVTLALADALAVALIKARNFQAQDFARFHPGGSLGRRLLTKVSDVMQTRLPIVSSQTRLMDIIATITEGRMGVAVVLDDDKLSGIITDGDIRRAFTAKGTQAIRLYAKDIMSTNPKTIQINEYINKAEEIMRQYKIHSLLVLDKDKVVGLVEFSS